MNDNLILTGSEDVGCNGTVTFDIEREEESTNEGICFAHYPLISDSNDIIGNHDGTDYNVTYDGNGALFNGDTQPDTYIHLPDTVLEEFTGKSGLSISITILPNVIDRDPLSIGGTKVFGTSNYDGSWVDFYLDSYDDTMWFWVNNMNAELEINDYYEIHFPAMTAGIKYYISATVDLETGLTKGFINGALVVSETTPYENKTFFGTTIPKNSFIGTYRMDVDDPLCDWFDGSISNVRLCSLALSDSEILDIYNEDSQ